MDELKKQLSGMQRAWRLDVDMLPSDAVLDGITFDDIILQLHCNVPKHMLKPCVVKAEIRELLESRLQDMEFLIENNIDKIIEKVYAGSMNDES